MGFCASSGGRPHAALSTAWKPRDTSWGWRPSAALKHPPPGSPRPVRLTGASSRAGSCRPPPAPPGPPCPSSAWGRRDRAATQQHWCVVAVEQSLLVSRRPNKQAHPHPAQAIKQSNSSQVKGDGLLGADGCRAGALNPRPLGKGLHSKAGGGWAAGGGGWAVQLLWCWRIVRSLVLNCGDW